MSKRTRQGHLMGSVHRFSVLCGRPKRPPRSRYCWWYASAGVKLSSGSTSVATRPCGDSVDGINNQLES